MGERERCRRCNAILASDNTGTHCGPCASKAAYDPAPPEPPPELWDRTEIRAAIGNRHIGQLFRAYRQAHTPAIPQQKLAEWLHLTQGHLSILERRRRPETDLERLERWSDTLHLPQQLRWFQGPSAVADATALRSTDRNTGSGPEIRRSTTVGAAAQDDELNVTLPQAGVSVCLSRRELLTALSAGIAVSVLNTRFEQALNGMSVDAGTLRAFEDAYDGYQVSVRSLPPAALTNDMIGDVAVLDGLRCRAGRAYRATIGRLQARYAESLSWLYEEAGGLTSALYWLDRASQWALAANWAAMPIYGFVRRSMMAMSFTSDGTRAVDNARAVLDIAQASPRLRGLAIKQMAFGHALRGEERASYRCLDAAMTLLSEPDDEEDAVLGQRSVASDDLFTIFRATCDVYLDKGEPAVSALKPRLASLSASSTRTATITRAKLACSYARTGHPVEATTLAIHALDDIDRIGSLSARSELQRAAPLLKRWSTRPDVRDVINRLAPATA